MKTGTPARCCMISIAGSRYYLSRLIILSVATVLCASVGAAPLVATELDDAHGARPIVLPHASGPPDRSFPASGFEEVITLPVGDGAGEIGIESGPDMESWGPSSFAVDAGGRLHILDGVNRRTVVVDPATRHQREIDWRTPIVCPVDIRIVEGRTFVLDLPADPSAVRELDEDGVEVASWEIPDIHLIHGVTGFAVAVDRNGRPAIRLELAGTWEVSLTTGTGVNARRLPTVLKNDVLTIPPSHAAEFGMIRSAGRDSFVAEMDWDSRRSARITALSKGRQSALFKVSSSSPLGAVRLLDVDERHNVYVYVEDLQGPDERPRAFIKRYASSGRPEGLFELPVDTFATHPFRSVGINHKGDTYVLIPDQERVVIARPVWTTDVSEDLPIPDGHADSTSGLPGVDLWRPALADRTRGIVEMLRAAVAPQKAIAAWTRVDANNRAWTYVDHPWYCSSSNFATRNGSIRPRYITSANRSYKAVPYCWGGFDTISSYNNALSSGLSAGDINCTGTKRSGTAGVDCSGFVSRLWGLGVKRSTYTLRDISHKVSKTNMQLGDAYIWPGSHCMFFRYYTTGGAQMFESTKTNSYDRVVTMNRTNAALGNYGAWRYQNW